MNTQIVAAPMTVSKYDTDPWFAGFKAYMAGAQLSEMPTGQHRRGWWAALDTQADFDTTAHLTQAQPVAVDMTADGYMAEAEDYADYQADIDYWRKGC